MNKSANVVNDLSRRLYQSLDGNYNVIDMDSVIDIISSLETLFVTKEQLEATRLARAINELRRKTANEALKRRSKNLLKKWRDMVIPSNTSPLPFSQNSNSRTAASQPSCENSNSSFNNILQQSNIICNINQSISPPFPHLVNTSILDSSFKRNNEKNFISDSSRSQTSNVFHSQNPNNYSNNFGKPAFPSTTAYTTSSKNGDVNENSNSEPYHVSLNNTTITATICDRSKISCNNKKNKILKRDRCKKYTDGSALNGIEQYDNNDSNNCDILNEDTRSKSPFFINNDSLSHTSNSKYQTKYNHEMLTFTGKFSKPSTSNEYLNKPENNNSTSIVLPKSCSVSPNYSCSNESSIDLIKEPTVNKKRGRKRKAPANDNAQYLDMKQKIASISNAKKVKTTKELLEDLQNKKNFPDNIEVETQLISNIDGPKASPPSCTEFSPLEVYKNDQSNNETKLEEISQQNTTKLPIEDEIASILSRLPPIPPLESGTFEEEDENEILCTCTMVKSSEDGEIEETDNISVNTVKLVSKSIFDLDDEDDKRNQGPPSTQQETCPVWLPKVDPECLAMEYYETSRNIITAEDVDRLHSRNIAYVNGNWNEFPKNYDGLILPNSDENVVPRIDHIVQDKAPKQKSQLCSPENEDEEDDDEEKPLESESGDKNRREFSEWYETVNVRTYNDDLLTILPYVIID